MTFPPSDAAPYAAKNKGEFVAAPSTPMVRDPLSWPRLQAQELYTRNRVTARNPSLAYKSIPINDDCNTTGAPGASWRAWMIVWRVVASANPCPRRPGVVATL